VSNASIPDLWPESLKVDVLTPFAILSAQAMKLTERTQGIVEGRVRSRSVSPGLICHAFELFAPVLEFRYPLFDLWHNESFVYPALITERAKSRMGPDDVVAAFEGRLVVGAAEPIRDGTALLDALRRVFAYHKTVSVISSLIARSNEARQGGAPVIEADDTPEVDGTPETESEPSQEGPSPDPGGK
jgi:hypothetical protein